MLLAGAGLLAAGAGDRKRALARPVAAQAAPRDRLAERPSDRAQPRAGHRPRRDPQRHPRAGQPGGHGRRRHHGPPLPALLFRLAEKSPQEQNRILQATPRFRRLPPRVQQRFREKLKRFKHDDPETAPAFSANASKASTACPRKRGTEFAGKSSPPGSTCRGSGAGRCCKNFATSAR